ncbi:MAG: TolB family protein [Anaerolineae bacterium]
MRAQWQMTIWVSLLVLVALSPTQAQDNIVSLCPDTDIQIRSASFEPGGLILTAFDSQALWVYDINRNTRYPLPGTRPCTSNCHLSPDAQWIIYLDPENYRFSKMRLNGTQRTPLVSDASEVDWWNQDTLVIWTTDQQAYLRPEADLQAEPEPFSPSGLVSIQPDGRSALRITGDEGQFNRVIVNLDDPTQAPIVLAEDVPYFNASAWSPDGQYLAYVQRTIEGGSELYLTRVDGTEQQQLTALSSAYGAVRINGYAPTDLSWSPDGQYLAFWVIPLTGTNPEADTDEAVLHVVALADGETRRYCHYSTREHTPETPRIIWSPDSTHLAFAGNIPGDDKGALLLAVDVTTGTFTELSNGMFPVYGIPQLNAWGTVP